MSPRTIVSIAHRFLSGTRRGRNRLIGAIAGVALSLIPLVLVQQVAEGMIHGITQRFVETGTYHMQAVLRGSPDDETDIPETVSRVRAYPGVVSASPERQGFGLVYTDNARAGVTIRAVPQQFYSEDAAVRSFFEMIDGEFLVGSESDIVLGVETARRLDVEIGDEIRLMTVRPLGEGRILPRVSRFTVRGVVSTGYRDLDRLWVFTSWERGLRIIPDETARDVVGIKIDNPWAIPNPIVGRGLRSIGLAGERRSATDLMDSIEDTLGMRWFLYDWYSLEEGRYVSFLTSRNLLSVVMAMIVVVAMVNISSALVLLVVEKEEEIAILRATGTTAPTVGALFVAAGLLIAIAGAVLGAATGLFFAINVNEILVGLERILASIAARNVQLFSADFYLERVPVVVAPEPLFAAVLLTLLLAVAAALIPAIRAARVPPDRILRRHG